MIDEFDSGIFEYLLGELVEIINESAKGQFVFTSHNLRVLEKLSYKSIVLTTINPINRYVRFTGIKTNNNIRDFYYTSILLGGQKEKLYSETKSYKMKKAFRQGKFMSDLKKVILVIVEGICDKEVLEPLLSELIDDQRVLFEVLREDATTSNAIQYKDMNMMLRIKSIVDWFFNI